MAWLCALAAIWVVLEPSRRRGEPAHVARQRVAQSIVRDPVFWFSAALVLFAGLRALNTGVDMVYDAEKAVWSISAPFCEAFPGCAGDAGTLPFATALAVFVLLAGARHSLGKSARASFLLVFSSLAAAAAVAHSFFLLILPSSPSAHVMCDYASPEFAGMAFGIGLLCAVVALFSTVENGWVKAEPVALFALAGNELGLVVFAPVATIAVFAAAFLLLLVASFATVGRSFGGSGSFRCAVAVLASLFVPVLFALAAASPSPVAAKVAAISEMRLFPEGFAEARAALSDIALKVWKSGPWLGTGLGSFPFDLRFLASNEAWAVVSPMQTAPMQGWWLLLAERGVVGATLAAVLAGFLAWTYFRRLVVGFRGRSWRPLHFLAPVAAAAVVAATFAECSFLRADAVLAALAAVAISTSAFKAHAATADLESKDG